IMLILGPAAAPTISAVTWYDRSSAGLLITLPSSTTSTAGSVTLAPISPDSLSTVSTSSTDAFSCLPPQRTIAYTESLSSYCQPAAGAEFGGSPPTRHHRLGRACLRWRTGLSHVRRL